MLYDAKLQLRCLADPRGEQLRELQLLFRRMLRGEVRVQTDSTSQLLGSNDVVTEDEWSQVLVQGCFLDPTFENLSLIGAPALLRLDRLL